MSSTSRSSGSTPAYPTRLGEGGPCCAAASRAAWSESATSSAPCPVDRPMSDSTSRRDRVRYPVTTRTDAYDGIRHDVIAGSERLRWQPDRQLAEVHTEVERAVEEYKRRARLGEQLPLGDAETMRQRVLRSITDLGPLTELLARPDVEEIFVEGARVTY